MNKLIGFNASLEQNLLAEALASRLGFQNKSDMMRALLDAAIAGNYTQEERDLIIRLTKPKVDIADESAPPDGEDSMKPIRPPIKKDSILRRGAKRNHSQDTDEDATQM